MNKRPVFGSVALALVLAFWTLGCTVKESSYAEYGKETDSYSKAESDETSENNEIQETVKYKSLNMDAKGVACYYIPDELAVEASTGDLIEILWSYGYNTGQIMSLRTPMNPILFEYG